MTTEAGNRVASKKIEEGGLIDYAGRRITYLRVSLTEKCNFRCGYCYGINGYNDRHIDGYLSDNDVVKLIKAFAILGIRKIRFTGGEPLLRKNVIGLIKEISLIDGISSIAVTTNGFLLDKCLRSLADSGVNSLNVSLDTLDRERFKTITGVDGFEKVYSAIMTATDCGAFGRVKINMVVMRGVNDFEIPRFARWALECNLALRFIEYMPSSGSGRDAEILVREDEIKDKTGLELKKDEAEFDIGGPSVYYRYLDYPGRLGFISSVSQCFCGGCNRLRLTSGGNLLGCLFGQYSVNLTSLLKEGKSSVEISRYLGEIVKMPAFRRKPGGSSCGDSRPFMRRVGG